VGGNGGNAGANAIQQKCEEADVLCNVIGVPKSIDNDILLIDKCFGFDTAVEEAQRALLAAKVCACVGTALGLSVAKAVLHHWLSFCRVPTRTRCLQVEASSARRGLGIVKLMGRQSGFIAMQASMASGACLGVGAWLATLAVFPLSLRALPPTPCVLCWPLSCTLSCATVRVPTPHRGWPTTQAWLTLCSSPRSPSP
jgi:hypothetical protein